jgi:hypothetical protein
MVSDAEEVGRIAQVSAIGMGPLRNVRPDILLPPQLVGAIKK